MNIKDKNGLSLIEIVIALGISSILAIVAGSFFSNMTIFKKKQEDNVNIALEHYIGNKVLWEDFRGASASFNVLKFPDDDGQDFYEHSFDEPCSQNCTRRINLELKDGQTKSNYFYVLTKDSSFVQNSGSGTSSKLPLNTVSIIPEEIYDLISFNNTNAQSVSDPVQFNRNNLVQELSSKLGIADTDLADKMLLLYAPNPLRDLPKNGIGKAISGIPDYSKAPRLYHHLTNINENGSELALSPIINAQVNLPSGIINDEIATGSSPRGVASISFNPPSGESLTGVNRFLRFLPGIHGTVPLVLVEPVSLVRYFITYPVDKASGQLEKDRTVLVREILSKENGSFSFAQRFEVSVGVKQVVFERKNISAPVVSYSTSFEKEDHLDF